MVNQQAQIFEEENDLSNWEFINASDLNKEDGDDDAISFSYSEYEDSLSNGSWLSWPSSDDQQNADQIKNHDHDHEIDQEEEEENEVPDQQTAEFDSPVLSEEEDGNEVPEQQAAEFDSSESSEKESEEDEEDEFDLDDELVPWGVYDRFERQRMRKLGKRGYAKMNKSKRLALTYTRPGHVYGKHGLGLKHNY